MTDPRETTGQPGVPQPLNRTQRRVLGVLIEKAFCTPEYYPMTINAIVTGCNQKSNRDPVVSLSAVDAEDALSELQKLGLTTRVYPATGRTERWRHNIKDAWGLDRAHRAVLAELLLRGAQTEGDLRSRASRMVDIPTLEELRGYLEEMAKTGFVRRLSPEEQKRGVVWTHLLMSPKELERVEQEVAQMAPPVELESSGGAPRSSAPAPRAASVDVSQLESQMSEMQALVSDLQTKLEELAAAHATLREEFDQLRQDLGA